MLNDKAPLLECNLIYPTADVLQRNYPRLYPNSPILCKECHAEEDNNKEHFALCSNNIFDFLENLITLINSSFTSDLRHRIHNIIVPVHNTQLIIFN